MSDLFHPSHPRRLIPELCQQFYRQGWFSGTGGGISIRQGDSIYVAPSGVQKERLESNDLFILKPDGSVSQSPPSDKRLTLSQCTPLFMNAYTDRRAGAVMHSHGKAAVLASLIYKGSEFRIRNIEMIKGLYNPVLQRMYRYDEELVVPIIENTCFESDLKDEMLKAMRLYPQSNAVMVRRHGIYVWGDSWQQCKTMAECYHYLCDMAVEMEKLGINEYTSGSAPAAAIPLAPVPKPVPATSPKKTAVETAAKPLPVPVPAVAKPAPAAAAASPAKPAAPATRAAAAASPKKTPTPAASTSKPQQPKKNAANNKKNTTPGIKNGRVAKRQTTPVNKKNNAKNKNNQRNGGPGNQQQQQWAGPPGGSPGGPRPLLPSPMMMMGPRPMGPGPMGPGPMGPPMMSPPMGPMFGPGGPGPMGPGGPPRMPMNMNMNNGRATRGKGKANKGGNNKPGGNKMGGAAGGKKQGGRGKKVNQNVIMNY